MLWVTVSTMILRELAPLLQTTHLRNGSHKKRRTSINWISYKLLSRVLEVQLGLKVNLAKTQLLLKVKGSEAKKKPQTILNPEGQPFLVEKAGSGWRGAFTTGGLGTAQGGRQLSHLSP